MTASQRILALVLPAACALVAASSATAGSYTLRPSADLNNTWNLGGGATAAWSALDDDLVQPATVPLEQTIYSSEVGQIARVALTDPPLAAGEVPTAGKAWFYANTNAQTQMTVDVIWNGVVRASTTVPAGAGFAWRSINITPPDQAAINAARLRFTAAGSTANSNVRAAYFSLATTTNPCALIGLSCTLDKQDLGSDPDADTLWGTIDCESDNRHTHVADPGYRRLTVLDGDDFFGERCELGRNEHRYGESGGAGTFELYREGERRITFIRYRLPPSYPLFEPNWQAIMQMKQTQPSANGGNSAVIALQARDGRYHLHTEGNSIWDTPAQANVWTLMAFDVTYSQDPAQGRLKAYIDVNGDGDFGDAGEQSPQLQMYTLRTETEGGNPADGIDPGEPIPSHLRVGLYHDTALSCPSPTGCATEVDDVRVMVPPG